MQGSSKLSEIALEATKEYKLNNVLQCSQMQTGKHVQYSCNSSDQNND